MASRPTLFLLAALGACGLIGCHRTPSQPPLPGSAHPRFSITDLGPGDPHGINNKGQVVGMFFAGTFPKHKDFPYFRGFLWDNGKRTEMKTLGGWFSDAGGITDNGQIVAEAAVPGRGKDGLPIMHGCLWEGQHLRDLDTDPRFRGTGILQITKSGAVYAVSLPIGLKQQQHLWYYPAGFGLGERQDLGVIGGENITVRAINDSGMVVGSRETGKQGSSKIGTKYPVHHAFLWEKGHMTDLGTLGGNNSEASAINNAGQTVGVADLAENPAHFDTCIHAFLWEHGKMRDLGALPGGDYSSPERINESGHIIGASQHNNGKVAGLVPVLWERGQLLELNQLIPADTQWTYLSGAYGINDKGQIVGEGSLQGDNHTHGYLLTPLKP